MNMNYSKKLPKNAFRSNSNSHEGEIEKKSSRGFTNLACTIHLNSSNLNGKNISTKYTISKKIPSLQKNYINANKNINHSISRIIGKASENNLLKTTNVYKESKNHAKNKNYDPKVKFNNWHKFIMNSTPKSIMKKSSSIKEMTSLDNPLIYPTQQNMNSSTNSQIGDFKISRNFSQRSLKNAPVNPRVKSRNFKILEEESSQTYSNNSKEELKGIESIQICEDPNINSKRHFQFFSKDFSSQSQNSRKFINDLRDTKDSSPESEEFLSNICISHQISFFPSPPCYTTMSKLSKECSLKNYASKDLETIENKNQECKYLGCPEICQFIKKKNYGILESKKKLKIAKNSFTNLQNSEMEFKSSYSNHMSKIKAQYVPPQSPGDTILISLSNE